MKPRVVVPIFNGQARSSNGLPRGASGLFPPELLASAAYKALSMAAGLALTRIFVEHLARGQRNNGRLPVSHRQFNEYSIEHGVLNKSVVEAITELEVLGLIQRTERGAKSCGGFADRPNLFRLTWLPVIRSGRIKPPTNEWRRYSSIKSAQEAVLAMRQLLACRQADRKALQLSGHRELVALANSSSTHIDPSNMDSSS